MDSSSSDNDVEVDGIAIPQPMVLPYHNSKRRQAIVQAYVTSRRNCRNVDVTIRRNCGSCPPKYLAPHEKLEIHRYKDGTTIHYAVSDNAGRTPDNSPNMDREPSPSAAT
jgi:hypothetical protein